MSKLIKMNLQLFAEEPAVDSGAETPAAEGNETKEIPAETGEKNAAAEPKQEGFEKAFAKRLSEAKSKWESEVSEKYKGYEDYKLAADYLQEANGLDMMTLKERIEMERLQTRAEKEGISPEVQKRLESLEAKAAKGDELEQKMQEDQKVQTYFKTLGDFSKDKGVEVDALNQFMIDNEVQYNPNNPTKSFEIALKAMKHDELASQIETAKKDGVKEFISAKSNIPNILGNKSQGTVQSPGPKTFAEARARAMQRFAGE